MQHSNLLDDRQAYLEPTNIKQVQDELERA